MRKVNKWLAYLKSKRWVKDYYTDLNGQNNKIDTWNWWINDRYDKKAQDWIKNKRSHYKDWSNTYDEQSPNWSLWKVSNFAKWWTNWRTWLWFWIWQRRLSPWETDRWWGTYAKQQAKLNKRIYYRPEYTSSNRYRWITWWIINSISKEAKRDHVADKWKWLSDSDKRNAEMYDLYNQNWEMPTFADSVQTPKVEAPTPINLPRNEFAGRIKEKRMWETLQWQATTNVEKTWWPSIRNRATNTISSKIKNRIATLRSSNDDDETTKLIGKKIK